MFWSRGQTQQKVGDCEKFVKGLKAIILSRVTNDMLSSSRRNSGNLRLVLKSLVSSRIVAFGCEIMSEEKNRGVDPKGEEVFLGSTILGKGNGRSLPKIQF